MCPKRHSLFFALYLLFLVSVLLYVLPLHPFWPPFCASSLPAQSLSWASPPSWFVLFRCEAWHFVGLSIFFSFPYFCSRCCVLFLSPLVSGHFLVSAYLKVFVFLSFSCK
uniref:Uncharacterized protein n=1 Tax=Opuntia streptacantha TaxID=393608 RepID=A0A7C9ERT1_OPUST